jgi:hypothetical protein
MLMLWSGFNMNIFTIHTVGANRLERRRRKVSFLNSPYLWSQSRYWSAVFFKSSTMAMGILTANFSPAALTVLREVRYKKVTFCRFFSCCFSWNTPWWWYILIFLLKITFLDAFCHRMIEKKFRKKNINFWSSCEFEILQNFWLSNFKDIYLVLVMEISKWIFWVSCSYM